VESLPDLSVLSKFLTPVIEFLASSTGSQLFHCTIRLQYALQLYSHCFEQKSVNGLEVALNEIAASLAYWASSTQVIHKPSAAPPFNSTQPLSALNNIHNLVQGKSIPITDARIVPINDWLAENQLNFCDVLVLSNHIQQLEEMCLASLYMFLSTPTPNIFNLHLFTGCFSVLYILDSDFAVNLPNTCIATMVRSCWYRLVLYYLFVGSPLLPNLHDFVSSLKTPISQSWLKLIVAARKDTDPHVIKLVYACNLFSARKSSKLFDLLPRAASYFMIHGSLDENNS